MNNQEIVAYILIFGVLLASAYFYYVNKDEFNLKCVVSTVDGNKYCVRERSKVKQAVNLLANTSTKCKTLIERLNEDIESHKKPYKAGVIRLTEKFNPNKLMETLPTSKYTAYSENKGEKLAFCLSDTSKKDVDHLIDEHTLMFVALHELAHIMTLSVGHKDDFWNNFKYLLEKAKEYGVHEPTNYKKEPAQFCGMKLNDNPYFDL